jgi:hypothetical protein
MDLFLGMSHLPLGRSAANCREASLGVGVHTLTDSLPGQRVSACTCKGEDHPGPVNTKGRGAPEIDAIEVSLFSNHRASPRSELANNRLKST